MKYNVNKLLILTEMLSSGESKQKDFSMVDRKFEEISRRVGEMSVWIP